MAKYIKMWSHRISIPKQAQEELSWAEPEPEKSPRALALEKQWEQALAAFNERAKPVYQEYDRVKLLYRQRKIGDKEFLAVANQQKALQDEFDQMYAEHERALEQGD